MPTARELYDKYMRFENSEEDHQLISAFGYNASEILEALTLWEKHQIEKAFLLGKQWTAEERERLKERQKEINQMQEITRREAIEKLKAAKIPSNISGNYYILDVLEAIGLIKFNEREEVPEIPAFEIYDRSEDKSYKIYASGRIEGFRTGMTVINRIPQLMAKVEKQNKAEVYFERDIPAYGRIRVEQWPEGLVVWIGGKIRYKSWE